MNTTITNIIMENLDLNSRYNKLELEHHEFKFVVGQMLSRLGEEMISGNFSEEKKSNGILISFIGSYFERIDQNRKIELPDDFPNKEIIEKLNDSQLIALVDSAIVENYPIERDLEKYIKNN